MDLFAEMSDKATRRHWHRGFGIKFGPGDNPPSPRDHRDETVVGMEVRVAALER
jgi:hypothetical protein